MTLIFLESSLLTLSKSTLKRILLKDIKSDFDDPELNRWFDTKLKDIQDEEEKEYLNDYNKYNRLQFFN